MVVLFLPYITLLFYLWELHGSYRGKRYLERNSYMGGGAFVLCLIVELITDCEIRYPFVLSYNYYVNKQSTQVYILIKLITN